MCGKGLRAAAAAVYVLMMGAFMCACGHADNDGAAPATTTDSADITIDSEVEAVPNDIPEQGTSDTPESPDRTGTEFETAKDDLVDFDALAEENPDIYAWIYIPGTDIDYPVLRASDSDDQYCVRGADGQPKETGCVYTEMYNSMDFSDFNTIIHGNDREGGDFYPLHEYEDPDYMSSHRTMYVVMPYTTLEYEIIAAYYDEGSDIMRRYDYTTVSGCARWITDYTTRRDMGMNRLKPSHELSTEDSFIVTLDGLRDEQTDRQFVVIASLVNSGSYPLTRYLSDEEDGFYENMQQDMAAE